MSNHRKVRVGIDVGGTHTKAVALDNETNEIVGESIVMTSHDDELGVAAGVIKCFQNCLSENGIAPEDVVFIAHSTTQATNALIEGDVAKVGILAMGGGGISGMLAKSQSKVGDILLDSGRIQALLFLLCHLLLILPLSASSRPAPHTGSCPPRRSRCTAPRCVPWGCPVPRRTWTG